MKTHFYAVLLDVFAVEAKRNDQLKRLIHAQQSHYLQVRNEIGLHIFTKL